MPILSGVFFFTFDQARDALWVKNQIDFQKLSLIGPWGSLTGIFFGPLWFWLLTIPYILSGGNPIAQTLFNSIFVFTTVIIASALVYRYSPRLAYFFCLLGFISTGVRNMAGTAFAQHMLPLFTFVYIFFLAQMMISPQRKNFYASVFFLSLLFHAEPPLIAFSIPSLGIILFLSRYKRNFLSIRSICIAFFLFMIPFLPFLFFEFRHDFLQTRALIEYFLGKNQSLGDILPFWARLIDRPKTFFTMFQLAVFDKSTLVSFFLLIITFGLHIKIQIKGHLHTFCKVSIIYIISLFFVFIIYKPQLKLFYLDGIQLIYIFWIAYMINTLWSKRYTRTIITLFILMNVFINLNIFEFAKEVKSNYSHLKKSTSIFSTQIAVVDWIYQQANGQGFKVYTYQPAVYDYPYQYIFFWYGVKNYGYLPEEFSYLPNKNDYVQNKTEQLLRLSDTIRKSEGTLYLIIEKDIYEGRIDQWRINFSQTSYSLVEEKSFSDGTTIQKRRLIK